MAKNERKRWLIAYDIRDPKRLAKVHRAVASQAAPVQYSVFTAMLTAAELDRLLDRLARLIDPQQDDIRAYLWPERGLASDRPAYRLPQGVWLIERGGKEPRQ